MNRREQFEEYVQTNRKELDALGIQSLGLFGSSARGTANSDSDFDIVVSFAPHRKSFSAFMQLADRLEAEFGEVDLLTRESIAPRFHKTILKELVDVRISA